MGASTRLIGGLIMTHSDDDGLILPPKVASAHVVLLPIIRKTDDRTSVMEFTRHLARELGDQYYAHRRISVEIDDRDIGGARGWDWIKKGVPIRVEIGPRDIAANAVFFSRRDKAHRDKTSMPRDQFVAGITTILDDIQQSLYDRAAAYRKANTTRIDTHAEFYDYFTPRNLKIRKFMAALPCRTGAGQPNVKQK